MRCEMNSLFLSLSLPPPAWTAWSFNISYEDIYIYIQIYIYICRKFINQKHKKYLYFIILLYDTFFIKILHRNIQFIHNKCCKSREVVRGVSGVSWDTPIFQYLLYEFQQKNVSKILRINVGYPNIKILTSSLCKSKVANIRTFQFSGILLKQNTYEIITYKKLY